MAKCNDIKRLNDCKIYKTNAKLLTLIVDGWEWIDVINLTITVENENFQEIEDIYYDAIKKYSRNSI